MPVVLDPKSTAKAKGKRLETLRKMSGLTRKQCEEKHGISASTLQAWENGKANSLTKRGSHQVLQIFRQEGMLCEAMWLLYGIGPAPQFHPASVMTEQPETKTAVINNQYMVEELLVFRSLHPNAVDWVVLDDGMGPWFREKDLIAGICYSGEPIKMLIGRDCIVQTAHRETLFRHIKQGSQPDLYHLICVNPATSVIQTTLYDQTLLFAAPVVWHRRPEYGDAQQKLKNATDETPEKSAKIFQVEYA